MKITYVALSAAFADVKSLDVKAIGRLIGGKVQINVDAGTFQNACALRLSYALNKAGARITSQDGAVSSGADGKKYLYRVSDLKNFVIKKLNYIETYSGFDYLWKNYSL